MILLAACYSPPDLPLLGTVPIVAAPVEGCRDSDEITVGCTIDGDTFDAGACGSGAERFRMLGVDAPETEKEGTPADCYADIAWGWLTGLIEGQEVTISFDRTCVDVYGRSLAYVWAREDLFEDLQFDPDFEPYVWVWPEDPEEGAILLNEVMLGEGYARQYPEDIAGTLIFQDRLDEAAAEAARTGRGLYGACGG